MDPERFRRVEELYHAARDLWHYAAAVFTMCGKPEKAVPLLDPCIQTGLPNYPLFDHDPHLRALHNRPEFLAS